jgi:glycosyltransferase involved in cell wall biosynthesis
VLTPSAKVPVVFGLRRRRPLRWAIPVGLLRLGREARHYDVLVSGSEVGYTFLLGWLVAKLLGKPYVVVVQSPVEAAITTWMPKPLQAPTRMVIGRVDAAICVADGLVSGVTDAGLDREKVFVVTVGLDVERARLLSTETANVPMPTGRYVVAAGRLSTQKGFDLLIRAHASIQKDTHGSNYLVIVGEGPERNFLEGLIEELGVTESVRMPGFVDNPHPMLANADLFVLSSRQEGMGGLVLLEALAHGTPIIAADCSSGPRELLDNGRFGELVPVDDADALAAAMLRYWRDPTELRRRALGGPTRAREFDPDDAAMRFIEILVTASALGRSRHRWFSRFR